MVIVPDGGSRGRILIDRSHSTEPSAPFDLLLYAVGYESRSRHLAEQASDLYSRAVGVRFNQDELFSFRANLDWAYSQEKISVEVAETEVAAGQILFRYLETSGHYRVLIDVSSFPRTYLAEIIMALWRFTTELGVDVLAEFGYSVPTFSEPALEHGPVVSFGAVRPDFVGLSETGWGLATLIGLGYEPDLALAAQQVLDPAVTWLGIPRSADDRFDDEVAASNEVLLDVVESENIWTYDVSNPTSTFVTLESIVSGLRRQHNVVLVPFGPKLFAAICMLVSLAHKQEVGVWRLSAGSFRESRDQVAAGPVHSLKVRFSAMAP